MPVIILIILIIFVFLDYLSPSPSVTDEDEDENEDENEDEEEGELVIAEPEILRGLDGKKLTSNIFPPYSSMDTEIKTKKVISVTEPVVNMTRVMPSATSSQCPVSPKTPLKLIDYRSVMAPIPPISVTTNKFGSLAQLEFTTQIRSVTVNKPPIGFKKGNFISKFNSESYFNCNFNLKQNSSPNLKFNFKQLAN